MECFKVKAIIVNYIHLCLVNYSFITWPITGSQSRLQLVLVAWPLVLPSTSRGSSPRARHWSIWCSAHHEGIPDTNTVSNVCRCSFIWCDITGTSGIPFQMWPFMGLWLGYHSPRYVHFIILFSPSSSSIPNNHFSCLFLFWFFPEIPYSVYSGNDTISLLFSWNTIIPSFVMLWLANRW